MLFVIFILLTPSSNTDIINKQELQFIKVSHPKQGNKNNTRSSNFLQTASNTTIETIWDCDAFYE